MKLAPLALGMLIASPPAGMWADRRGSRTLAVLGMLVSALGLALMTTLQRDTGYVWPGIYMFIVGIGSGMFNSPNTAAMMGSVAPHRRGIAAGARVAGAEHRRGHLDRVRAGRRHLGRPQARALRACSPAWPTTSPTPQLMPFISNMHTALWCLCAVSIVGAGISAARPKHVIAPWPRSSRASPRLVAS